MKQNKLIRSLIIAVAAVLLLLPGLMPVLAWGSTATLNLEVGLASIAVCIALAVWMPKWKWIGAVIASLLIAVPPFPYWSGWDESRGRYFHFFHGFNLQNIPITTFVVVFLIAMLLFAAIFWAVGQRSEKLVT